MYDTAVLTLGTFDLFHAGHVDFLEACAKIGTVTVAINTDKYAGAFKPTPICNEQERKGVVSAMRCVMWTEFNDGKCSKVIERWTRKQLVFGKHMFLAIGEDWMPTHHYLHQLGVSEKWLANLGVQLIFIADQSHLHTSEIKERCQKRLSP